LPGTARGAVPWTSQRGVSVTHIGFVLFPKWAENHFPERNFALVRSADQRFSRYFMRIWKIAAVAVLALTSFAAENVAPTKSELEEMYNAAYRAFDSNKFPEALKQLDAIDARQPDLAASKNLRGVILMRQGSYDTAETALQEAARIDPKFWNARFNLAEIPFLKKDWAEARNRFEQLLSTGESDLAKEASQLIQYKILLTYLLEGKGNMVDSILAKLELSPDTPAVDYVKAAVALQQKNQREAKDWISAAEKNFSPQLNKLFAESLYEVGWLEKPAGAARPSLPLMTAAERSEKTKAMARSKFEQSQQALRQRDYATARKLIDETDQADPNQPATLNLRGEILMQQGQLEEAEAAFKKAAKLDPKFREAQYNLAQIPFKKKDYSKARDRFEALYNRTPGGDKNQAAELIKFKIYMSLLLEGKESRAHAMMEEFQFTGDTPALYYAQAAWEFKHNNPEKAADWTASANKIYSPALNNVFADAFYDVGWMQSPEIAAVPAPAFDSNVVASQAGGGPAVEPSPIPDSVFAANRQGEASKGEPFALGPAAKGPNAGMEIAGAGAASEQPSVSALNEPASGTGVQPEQSLPAAAAASSSSSGESTTAPAEAPKASSASKEQSGQPAADQTNASANPAVGTAPAKVAKVWPSNIAGIANRRMWLVGGLLLAAIFLLAWVIVPALRRYTFNVPSYSRSRSVAGPAVFKPRVASAQKGPAQGNSFFGGPRQISLQLTASKPSLGHTAMPSGKLIGSFDRLKDLRGKVSRAPAYRKEEPDREVAPLTAAVLESSVGQVVEQAAEVSPSVPQATEIAEISAIGKLTEPSPIAPQEPSEIWEGEEEVTLPTQGASEIDRDAKEAALAPEDSNEIFGGAEAAFPAVAASAELSADPMKQEQPVPHQRASTVSQSPVAETAATPASDFPSAISTKPVFPQTTTPATMPETTQTPTAPINKAPTPPVAKPQQPAAAMQTSVQLTFFFEIAAMQLTPSFKMGVLKVRPISKLVTMRLPSSQQPQSALNLQVTFEVAKIQPVGGALGTVRMIPSQQQRPTGGGLPSFAVAGLQVVTNSETAPVQLTPSQQGRASVLITVPFQITTLEFSPSLEIASVILNSNSKQVAVQLPGAGPGSAEGAPMFEITNLELNESGDIGMMQLNLLGRAKRA
jgi:tetratricopeptide (TPR) repeat protein